MSKTFLTAPYDPKTIWGQSWTLPWVWILLWKFTKFAIFWQFLCTAADCGLFVQKCATAGHPLRLAKARKLFFTSKISKSQFNTPKYPRNIREIILDPSLGSNLRNSKSRNTLRCREHDLTGSWQKTSILCNELNSSSAQRTQRLSKIKVGVRGINLRVKRMKRA